MQDRGKRQKDMQENDTAMQQQQQGTSYMQVTKQRGLESYKPQLTNETHADTAPSERGGSAVRTGHGFGCRQAGLAGAKRLHAWVGWVACVILLSEEVRSEEDEIPRDLGCCRFGSEFGSEVR